MDKRIPTKPTSAEGTQVLSELRARAQAKTLDWDEVAYHARVASRTLRRWVAGEISAPSPRLVERLHPVLFAA